MQRNKTKAYAMKDAESFHKIIENRKTLLSDVDSYYNNYSPEEYNESAKDIRSAVYVFFVENPKGKAECILNAVKKAKEKKENKLPKLNDDENTKKKFEEHGCLYIGSVTSETLGKRISQHWRKNDNDVGNSTYALKISDWIDNIESRSRIKSSGIKVYFYITVRGNDLTRLGLRFYAA